MPPAAIRICLVVLASATLLSVAPAVAQPLGRPAADVYADDQSDRYVGTGGLVLPRSVDHGTREHVAGCLSCEWRLAAPCVVSTAGVPFPGQSVCQSVVRGCPATGELLRAWIRQPSQPWREIGLVCVGEGGPVTVSDLGRRAREQFVRDLPDLLAGFQPGRGVLAQVPVIFSSGQAGEPVSGVYSLLGETVTVSGTPAWTWQFGDGAALSTTDPGGPYPHAAVSHAYRRAGSFGVSVVTRWEATFTVGDLGPYPVAGSIDQDDRVVVAVGEGRAVLAVR